LAGLLEGKSVIVTGAAGGIGSIACLTLAEEGAKVVAVDWDEAGGEAVVKTVRDAGHEAVFVKTDITDEDQVKAMVERAVQAFGRLDCALNNAGAAFNFGSMLDVERSDFQRSLDLNVLGTWMCMKHEIPRMLDGGGGTIVNMASLAGVLGIPDGVTYSTAKHAVVGLTKCAAAEFGVHAIRVNAICPGVVLTPPILAAAKGGVDFNKMNPNALNRACEPREVAELAAWLLSARSSYVTGQAINIDGGKSAATYFTHQFAAE